MTTGQDAHQPMRIIGLHMSNIMAIKAIDIQPDPTMQIIGGNNGQGKTSILDAIQFALENAKASRIVEKPLRDGEKKGEIIIDLGDLTVRRTFNITKTGGQLTVKDKTGKTLTSPQDVLNRLTGKMGFDPIEFNNLPASEQRNILLSTVDIGIDLDEYAQKRKALYDERTQVGRERKLLGAMPDYDETLPADEKSAEQIIGQISEATKQASRIQQAKDHHAHLTLLHDQLAEQISSLQEKLADLQSQLETVDAQTEDAQNTLDSLKQPADITSLQNQLANIEQENKRIRENNRNAEILDRNDELTEQYDSLTAKIDALDAQRDQALSETQFPVDGLSVSDDSVLYKGVPYAQASSGEKIKVALAIAMASNPVIRVIHIKDGSLLDDQSMRIVRQMLSEHGFQAFVERVGDADKITDPATVIIEDGQVKE